jgi:rhodanese-related sulfurtransferase/polyisoprenoid-binding protein YceI
MNTQKTISPEALQQQLEQTDAAVLIHTLPEAHYAQAHIPGAQLACVYEVTFLDRMAALVSDKATPIIVYGSSQATMDAPVAADKLIRAGYRNVAILEGGLQAWTAAGYALEGLSSKQPPAAPVVNRFQEGLYRVDTDQSVIEWAGRNPNTTHNGTIRISEGRLEVSNTAVTGGFSIDMRRIENHSLAGDDLQPVLVAHLLSDDFFFADRFPTVRYALKAATLKNNPTLGLPNYTIRGQLELRGVSTDLDFDATLNPVDEHTLVAEAHFDLDRTRWGVIYGSSRFFEHLGMHLVFDLLSFQLKVVLKKDA